jgi:hypothetical protein
MHYTPHVDFAFNSVEHGPIIASLFSVNEFNYDFIVLGGIIGVKPILKKSLSDYEFLE